MDGHPFNDLVRSLASSRRSLWGGTLAASTGWLGVGDVVAKKKRNHKRKKVTFNDLGCVDVGGFCKNGGQCCSGVCRGKKGKNLQKCKAHDTGGCQAGQSGVVCGGSADDVACTTTSGDTGGTCSTTTGKGAYCSATRICFACTKDADCQAICGPQAACVTCVTCVMDGTSTACLGPSEDSCAYT